jgi:hypothetical protein
MKMLSDDDLNLKALNDEELVRAWDLWFTLAQSTNASDLPYSHGVFAGTNSHSRSPRMRVPETSSSAASATVRDPTTS